MTEELTSLDEDLARLRGYATNLTELGNRIIKDVKFDFDKDHMGLMAFLIVNKQLEHLKSIIILNNNQQYRDTQLIARTMAEGLALIYWASQDQDKRPLQWRSCAWVEEFARYYGKTEYTEYTKEIEVMLSTLCKPFLRAASKNKTMSEITPNDYIRSCRWDEMDDGIFKTVNIKKTFEDAGIKLIYESYYASASNWAHWNPIGIAEAIKPGSGVPNYSKETKYLGAIGYISGFKFLLQSTKFLNGYFKLEFNETLDELEKDFDANSGPTT
jgi:hypothetical protein